MGQADFALRAYFCMWYLHRCMEEPKFPRQILFTEEYRFTKDTVLNSRNRNYAQYAHGFQQRFSINMWTGIVDRR